MNFFGHAVVASWASDDPALAFGSMLPDFAHMLGVARIESSDATVTAGIALHHACDEVFHTSATFVRLQNKSRTLLSALGLPRGAGLATSHVGVELMLDSELSRDPAHLKHYLLSINHGLRKKAYTVISAQPSALPADTDPLGTLLTLLVERVDRLAPQNGTELAERLFRILSPRPRLAFAATAVPQVAEWAEATWPELRAQIPAWLQEISTGLALQSGAPRHGASRLHAQGLEPRRG